MAGLAAALGGAGQEATQLGAQIRPILERQREGYAALLSKQAEEEGNPDYRNQLLKLSGQAISGEPLHKIIPAHQKLMEAMQADHAMAGQLAQQMSPKPQQPPPGPAAPGQTPGTQGYAGLLGGAAQPPSSPVSPQQQTTQKLSQESMGNVIPPVAPQPQAQQIPPVTVTPQAQSTDPLAPIREINTRYAPMMAQSAPAMRKYIQDMQDKEVQAATSLVQKNLAMGNAQSAEQEYQKLRSRAGFDPIRDYPEVSILFQKYGLAPPGMAGLGQMLRAQISSYPMQGSADDAWREVPELAQQMNLPHGSNTPVHFRRSLMDNRILAINNQPIPGMEVTGTDPSTGQVMYGMINRYDLGPVKSQPGFTPTPGSQLTPIKEPTAGGGVVQTNAADISAGRAPKHIAEAVSPPMFGSITERPVSTVVNGQPVTEKVPFRSGKVAPGAQTPTGGSPSLEVPSGPNGEPPISLPQGFVPPIGQQGSNPSVFPKFSENQLSASGQKDVSSVDQVLQQVKDLQSKMKERGWQNDDTHSYYPDYVKYMHGGYASPNQDLYTGLSFEAIRSSAAALKSTGSRAYQFIQRALDHTPNLSLSVSSMKASDTPKTMYGKLQEMETILSGARQQIMEDEKKSGVVPSAPQGGSVPPVIRRYNPATGKIE